MLVEVLIQSVETGAPEEFAEVVLVAVSGGKVGAVLLTQLAYRDRHASLKFSVGFIFAWHPVSSFSICW